MDKKIHQSQRLQQSKEWESETEYYVIREREKTKGFKGFCH
jgi:hypothetical protein